MLGAATLKDGRQLLFGLRFSALQGHGGANPREVVLLEQRSAGGAFLAWRGLGNPERDDDRGRRIGCPGRGHGPRRPGPSLRTQRGQGHQHSGPRRRGPAGTAGRISAGGEIQDGLSTVVDSAGRVHVFGAGHDSVHHWTQDAPGQPLSPRSAGPCRSPSTLPPRWPPVTEAWSCLRSSGPRRPKGAGRPRPLTSIRADGVRIPGIRFDGYGPVSAAASPRGPVLLGKDLKGQVQLRVAGGLLTRTTGTPAALDTPALHIGRSGATVVGLGADAHPWTWSPEAGTAG